MTDPLQTAIAHAVSTHYTIERPLGPRDTIAVFLARDLRLERPVVLNVLPADGAAGELARSRFLARATQAARLAHPNIVPIHEVDRADGLAWYVSSFVHGRSLASRLATEGPLPPSVAVQLARELAWALAYAHEEGVVHGALGPAQIYLEDGTGRALITGFGNAPGGDAPEPATDLRALAATVAFALRGAAPSDATEASASLAKLPAWASEPLAPLVAPGARVTAPALVAALTPPARVEAPPVLRRWLDAKNPLKVFLVSWSGLNTMMWLLNSGGTVDTYIYNTWSPWLLLWPVAILQLRPVLRAGFGPPDVLGVLDQQLQIRREEMGDQRPRGRPTALTWIILLALMGYGATLVDPFIVAHSPMVHFLFIVIGLMAVGLGYRAWRDRGRPPRARDEVMEARAAFWHGPLGRWTFRFAALGLRRSKAASSGLDQRPTTVILADSIRDLAQRLPKGLRQQFPDVLGTVDRLDRAAEALRSRVRRLEALAVAGGNAVPAAALQGARDRHADAVVALETMRLALLAAQGRVADIGVATQELADAVEVADRIGHLAAGKDAVELVTPG